ncbi:disease resistance protein Aig2, partial [Aspergillus sp. HF37]
MASHTLFVYGTLMVPEVLHRVLHNNQPPQHHHHPPEPKHPKPAILHNYQRRRVRYADYPGIIPSSSSSSPSTDAVLGALVYGLSDADLRALDAFEGIEYEKRVVRVRVLHEAKGLGGRREESVGKSAGGHVRDVLDAASGG